MLTAASRRSIFLYGFRSSGRRAVNFSSASAARLRTTGSPLPRHRTPAPCGCPGPFLTEYASEEYGQGIRCLFHLPSAYSGRGGKCGKEPLGILAGCQVKGPARKVGGESPCPDKIPLQTRCGTTSQAESFTERHRPRLRERSPVILIEIGLHGNTFSVPWDSSKDQAIRHGPPPSPPRTV